MRAQEELVTGTVDGVNAVRASGRCVLITLHLYNQKEKGLTVLTASVAKIVPKSFIPSKLLNLHCILRGRSEYYIPSAYLLL